MNVHRIAKKVDAPAEFASVTMRDTGTVIIRDAPLPDCCTPSVTDIRVEYPDTYPDEPPTVAVTDRVTVDGELAPGLRGESDGNGWHRFGGFPSRDTWTERWDAEIHTAVTVIGSMLGRFEAAAD